MAIGTVLGFVGAVGSRYFVSQVYHMPRSSAMIYNALDMVVSATAYGVLRKLYQGASPTHELALGILLISRVAGLISGALVIESCGRTELSILVVLNGASLMVCWFMRNLSDIAPPPTTGQEGSPSAPPPEPWKVVYF